MRAASHQFMSTSAARNRPDRKRPLLFGLLLTLAGAQLAAAITPRTAYADEELFDPDTDFDAGDDVESAVDVDEETSGADEDPFAYAEPEPMTAVRARLHLGAGPGFLSQDIPLSQTLQPLGSAVLPVAHVTADIDTAALNKLGAGARFSYATTIGQSAQVEATPGVIVSAAARQQAVRGEFFLRIPLGEDERPVMLPLFLGAGFTGFNTDEPLPVLESTLFDIHFRPALRIPLGTTFELEFGPEAGLLFAVLDDLPRQGLAEIGFSVGGDLLLEAQLAESIALRLSGHYRQLVVPETEGERFFVSTWLYATLGVSVRL